MGRPRLPFRRCSKCSIELPLERKGSYCNECNKKLMRFSTYANQSSLTDTPQNIRMKKQLIEFVDRLQKRKEMASMHEIFVEMITLNNHFCKERETTRDENAQIQIKRMWQNLKAIYEKIKEPNGEK